MLFCRYLLLYRTYFLSTNWTVEYYDWKMNAVSLVSYDVFNRPWDFWIVSAITPLYPLISFLSDFCVYMFLCDRLLINNTNALKDLWILQTLYQFSFQVLQFHLENLSHSLVTSFCNVNAIVLVSHLIEIPLDCLDSICKCLPLAFDSHSIMYNIWIIKNQFIFYNRTFLYSILACYCCH